jgi:hypothetical protein
MMTTSGLAPLFQSGQVWRLKSSHIQIGLIDELLIHYKHYKGANPRGPTSMASQRQLEQLLKEQNAVLVAEMR